ncbi:DUF3239 domain-containing protein [Roseibacillus persicicus]|uniref:DUF3239 domain-containing protein n=1 Tax=Roseibacillus persicicus TaxID=454148 RepID=A0A918WKE5_9BACT|nr:DUF3239 domain-containing protein [Roseibacillus persicicus]GHC54473.1 hypothetical protein GCM10007100_21120 [Roseibacillus persicicus]
MSKEIGAAGSSRNWSQASSATNFNPNLFRYVWFNETWMCKFTLWSLLIAGLLIGAAILLAGILAWLLGILGALIGLVGLAVGTLMGIFAWVSRDNFKNGLLTAAMVESVSEPSLIQIGVLSRGGRKQDYLYGVKRIKYLTLPKSLRKVGLAVPCVSTFSDEVRHPGTWHDFDPVPVAFGTSDRKKLKHCLEAVTSSEDVESDYFTLLQAFLSHHPFPADFEDLYVCDGAGRLVETRTIAKKAHRPEPS